MNKLFLGMVMLCVFVFTSNGWGGDQVAWATRTALDPITFVHPAPGEIIHSGHDVRYTIEWSTTNPQATKFKLFYSFDNGATWTLGTPTKVTGFTYEVPMKSPDRGNRWIKLMAVGYTDAGTKVAKGISENTLIEVIKLISPDTGAGPFVGGQPGSISWHLWEPVDPVRKVNLFITLNGGRTWKKIKPGIPALQYVAEQTIHTYTGFNWPAVTAQKTNCRVKVVITDESGFVMGTDKSDEPFTIDIGP
jgi:hypothetical protein